MRGLNRIEILVVMFAGLVMLAVAVPWFLNTRGTARDNQCSNNLLQLHIAFQSYAEANGARFPFGTHINAEMPPEKRLSWTVGLLPNYKERRRYQFDFSQPWDADSNRNPTSSENQFEHVFPLFRCPADENKGPPNGVSFSSYVGMTGLGKDSPILTEITPESGLWGYNRQTQFAQILDGREHTVNLIETGRKNGPWIAGGPMTLRPLLSDDTEPFGRGMQFGGHHVEGTQVLFADGSVKMINNAMDATVFGRLCTIDGK